MPQFKYSLVQKGKLFAKVLEIITICSPALLLKGLFVMFAASFVYLKGRPILCPDIAFERKPRGLQKQQSCTVTRILRQSQLELNIWTKSKLVKLFVRSVPKEILVSNLIFSFYCIASADSALSTFMTLSGREIREGNLLKTHFMFAWVLVKDCKCYELENITNPILEIPQESLTLRNSINTSL